jgi:hypothetical protein
MNYFRCYNKVLELNPARKNVRKKIAGVKK